MRASAPIWSPIFMSRSVSRTQDGSGHPVRFYHHPFVPWIWLGALIMALGGFVSLADRRWRVGAPSRSAASPMLPAAIVPAE